MNILITGGLGYIGGRLASFLKVNTEAKIFLTTRDKKECPAWANDCFVLNMDLLDENSIGRVIDVARPDTIIHLAALNQNDCLSNPKLAEDINVNGTKFLLKFAEQKNVKQFIYFSTFQVYGKLIGEVTEETPIQPQNPYAVTKYAGEKCVMAVEPKSKMKTLIFRLANGYGYPIDKAVNVWHLVFNSFCTQCMKNGKIAIKSNQYRNFIALEDVVRAVHHVLYEAPQKWGDGIFNLGGEQCLAVLDVAQRIAQIYQDEYGQEIGVEFLSENNAVLGERFQYSINKLKETGFELKSDMQQEVIGTLKLLEKSMKEQV